MKQGNGTFRAFLLLAFTIVAIVNAYAGDQSDADALFKKKKWTAAAKAYDAFATRGTGGREHWRAVLRAALAREKGGDRKKSMAGANDVIKGALLKECNDIVGEAFLLKQRLMFRAKEKDGPRAALLTAASSRLGRTSVTTLLHEREAVRCLKDGKPDLAWEYCANRGQLLSPLGSNIVAVLEFVRTRKGGRAVVSAKDTMTAARMLGKDDSELAMALVESARNACVGMERVDFMCRERLTPNNPGGYDKCQAAPADKIRRIPR